MDDIFSPIVRQFKKINLGPFTSVDETTKCVSRPLEKLGIPDVSEIVTNATMREIHELSGGRPYEIQLICHFLFKRLQISRAEKLELNVEVLDDVKLELETSQDVSLRPIVTAIRSLRDAKIRALHLLCAANNHATFEQIWFTEFVFRGSERFTKESLQEHLKRLDDLKLVTQRDGIISFLG